MGLTLKRLYILDGCSPQQRTIKKTAILITNSAAMNKKTWICFVSILFLSGGLGFGQEVSRPGRITEVGVWDVFEISFTNKKDYDDPFRDVQLDIRYIKPSGEIITFMGFYDGNHTWKARFMPDQIGVWEYFAVFSDRVEAGKGEFEVVPSDIPGPVAADRKNSLWFGYKSGKHGLIRCFHVGDRFFAANWEENKRQEFLDWAQHQGYNTLSVASFFLKRNVEGRGKGWQTPALWALDENRPQPEEYRKAEKIIAALAKRKMLIYPFAGFFGQSSDFPLEKEDQELYIKYTIARFGPFWNLFFNVAGPEPLWRPDAYAVQMPASEIIRLGNLIDKWDEFDHVLSVHNETGTDPFRFEDWHDYVTLQGAKENPGNSVYQYIIKQAEAKKPVFAQEVFWPGNKYHPCDCRDAETIRNKAYTLLFAGAAINFADMDGNSSSGFSGSLNLNDRHQEWHDIMKDAWDWLETIPYYQMRPVNEMVENGYMLAQEGLRYASYVLDASRPVRIDLAEVPEQFSLKWFNTKTNQYEKGVKIVAGGATITLETPDKDNNWILLLEKID